MPQAFICVTPLTVTLMKNVELSGVVTLWKVKFAPPMSPGCGVSAVHFEGLLAGPGFVIENVSFAAFVWVGIIRISVDANAIRIRMVIFFPKIFTLAYVLR
jgi:hypothetical protein